MNTKVKSDSIEDRKKLVEELIIKRYSFDSKSQIMLDNIFTYAIGNAFMVGYENTKEFLLFMFDGIVSEADTLKIMHDLFGNIQ